MPEYIEKVEIWSDVTMAGRTDKKTNEQGKIELLSQCNGPWTAEMRKMVIENKRIKNLSDLQVVLQVSKVRNPQWQNSC